MAKIVTSFDTQTKEFAVSIDDKKIKNVSAVEFYGMGDNKGYCELTTVESTEDRDMIKVTRISADENENESYTEDNNVESVESVENVSEEIFELAKYFRTRYPSI